MTIYQITILSFFTNNSIDYGMAIDHNKDIILFTDQNKAMNKFNELITEYTSKYNQSNEFLYYGSNNCTVIYHDDTKTVRTYICLDPKETE